MDNANGRPVLDVVVKVFMWVVWLVLVEGCFVFHVFLVDHDGGAGSSGGGLSAFVLVMMVVPFAVCMLLRFALLRKIRHPLALFPVYVFGVFLSQGIMLFGIFLFPGYRLVFYVLCAVAMLAYIPIGIRPKKKRGDRPESVESRRGAGA